MGGLYLQASCLTILEISLEKKINKEIFAFIRITMGFTIKVCVIEKHLLIVGIFTRYEYSMKISKNIFLIKILSFSTLSRTYQPHFKHYFVTIICLPTLGVIIITGVDYFIKTGIQAQIYSRKQIIRQLIKSLEDQRNNFDYCWNMLQHTTGYVLFRYWRWITFYYFFLLEKFISILV